MADINYPSTLPEFKVGKQRSEVQTFRTSQPFNGSLYTEKFTDDSPVTWTVTVDCIGQVQARQFQQFIKYVDGGLPFNKDIMTENNFVEHEVKFIDMPLQPVQISAYIWQYTGTIYATALINPDDDIDNPELIFEWLQGASIIDNALNNLWN